MTILFFYIQIICVRIAYESQFDMLFPKGSCEGLIYWYYRSTCVDSFVHIGASLRNLEHFLFSLKDSIQMKENHGKLKKRMRQSLCNLLDIFLVLVPMSAVLFFSFSWMIKLFTVILFLPKAIKSKRKKLPSSHRSLRVPE